MALKKKDSLVSLGRNFPTLQIEEMPISRLKWNARSPRLHPEKQIAMLARNIDTYGFLHPCLISDQNRLLCGTARVLAAKRLGMETIPAVRVSHLSDDDQRAVILADAKLSELAEWNPEVLREELQFFTELDIGFDFSILGFETAEVDIILDDSQRPIEDGSGREPSTTCNFSFRRYLAGWRASHLLRRRPICAVLRDSTR
jgi:hypothetical protein